MFELLRPLEVAVAWIMVTWHTLLTAVGMDEASGWTWALSIVGLVVVIRILLIPLFVRQIKASRGLQLMQPDLQKIQAKYKGKSDTASRQAMGMEMQELYKKHKTNPLASCLPILLQAPIFFALFRVLNGLPGTASGRTGDIGPLDERLAAQAENSELFGAQLSATFLNSGELNVQVLTVVLVVLMSLTTFTTQRQLMRKNMPATALNNPFAQQQKILLYVLPLVFAVSGVNFPIGVLLYWLTTNLWSMGQQFYVIRRNPVPGSPAEKDLLARRRAKAIARGQDPDAGSTLVAEEPAVPTKTRQQPKKQTREQRRRAAADAERDLAAPVTLTKPVAADPAPPQANAEPELAAPTSRNGGPARKASTARAHGKASKRKAAATGRAAKARGARPGPAGGDGPTLRPSAGG